MASTTITDFNGAIDTISGRTDGAGSPASPHWRAEERRMILRAFTPGVVLEADGWQVTAGAGGTMNVVIGSGNAESDLAIVAGTVQGQGNYVVRMDEASKTLALTAADPSNSRIDSIYLLVHDNTYDASGFSLPRLACRTGDPATSPSAPGPESSWKASLLLANILVPASAPDIASCTIIDMRVFSSLESSAGGMLPAGAMVPFLGSVAPSGYYLAQGQAISRADNKRLFAAIGTTYGAGDGSTTFNLPDMRQRFPLGRASSGTGSVLGSTGGSINHTHSGPSHSHTNPNVSTASSHVHNIGSHNHSAGSLTTNVAGSHEHTRGSQTTTRWEAGAYRMNADGGHSHSIFGNTLNTSLGDTGSGGGHNHTQGSTGSSGTGQTGTNNPPYLVVNYIVKR